MIENSLNLQAHGTSMYYKPINEMSDDELHEFFYEEGFSFTRSQEIEEMVENDRRRVEAARRRIIRTVKRLEKKHGPEWRKILSIE